MRGDNHIVCCGCQWGGFGGGPRRLVGQLGGVLWQGIVMWVLSGGTSIRRCGLLMCDQGDGCIVGEWVQS